jgi:hypothetical protein
MKAVSSLPILPSVVLVSLLHKATCHIAYVLSSIPNSISIFKDTSYLTYTICTFSYGLRRSYEVINTASISYRDHIYIWYGPGILGG